MARPAWALARAWPKSFYFLFGKKKKKTEKKTGKRAKWANQQSEQNLKTSFTLSLSLLSLARYTYSHTTSTAVPCSTTTPQSPRRRHRKSFKHQSTTAAFLSLCSEKPLHKEYEKFRVFLAYLSFTYIQFLVK
jgi:hypothetical protein